MKIESHNITMQADKETIPHLKLTCISTDTHLMTHTQYHTVERYQQMEVFCFWSFGTSLCYFSEFVLCYMSCSPGPDQQIQTIKSHRVEIGHSVCETHSQNSLIQ